MEIVENLKDDHNKNDDNYHENTIIRLQFLREMHIAKDSSIQQLKHQNEKFDSTYNIGKYDMALKIAIQGIYMYIYVYVYVYICICIYVMYISLYIYI